MDKNALEGLKVLDLTQAMAGPFASMLLGDLGAEIIKIEPLKGDQTRKWVPPYLNGMSAYFLSTNRNKKSIAIDLKSDEGKNIFYKLCETSDVIIENFRPGTMEKLGISYESIKKIKEDIIYCSISGFGSTGPLKDLPGYDLTVLAYSGLLSLNSENNRTPIKFGVPIADITSGLFSDIAILSAIVERKNNGTGQHIDMSMLDSNFLELTHQAFYYFGTEKNPEHLGSAHQSIAPYQVYKSFDGYIAIAAGSEKLWNDLLKAINREDLKLDDRFTDNKKRVNHRNELEKELNFSLSLFYTEDLIKKLNKYGIPCAPINNINETVENDQLKYRKMVTKIKGKYGEIPMLGTPFKMSETPGEIKYAPPELGENTDEILKSLGFKPEEIKSLKEKNVVNNDIKTDELL